MDFSCCFGPLSLHNKIVCAHQPSYNYSHPIYRKMLSQLSQQPTPHFIRSMLHNASDTWPHNASDTCLTMHQTHAPQCIRHMPLQCIRHMPHNASDTCPHNASDTCPIMHQTQNGICTLPSPIPSPSNPTVPFSTWEEKSCFITKTIVAWKNILSSTESL